MIQMWNRIILGGVLFLIASFTAAYFLMELSQPVVFLGAAGGLVLVFLLFMVHEKKADQAGRKTPVTEIVHIFEDYTFLLQQLVARDFAVRYKRSYLGVLWVVMSPLMTMIVMSSVFSYIFRQSIDHYPVYLILGSITFSFFSEATNNATQSVVSGGQLIKKVYIPKFIFPISRVFFSFYNYLLTFIPAFLVMLFFRIVPSRHILLLPLVLLELYLFAQGIGFFLSAMNVFMRDTQYLYGIILTLWMYVTPIFYSADLVSPLIRRLMYFNPLFLYIDSIRRILLYHTAPTAMQLTGGLIMGVAAFTIGLTFFFRKQDRFILYI